MSEIQCSCGREAEWWAYWPYGKAEPVCGEAKEMLSRVDSTITFEEREAQGG